MGLPQVVGIYRFDFDFFGHSCNGTDTIRPADDTVQIISDGNSVLFIFSNEFDDPTGLPNARLIYEPGRGVSAKSPCLFGALTECDNDPLPMAKPLLIEVIECAISLEADPAKKAALKQILTIMTGAQAVYPD